jgi:hypothetical protein
MPKFKLIALTSPVAGQEAEFHAWYQNQHLPQLVGFAGVQGAQRYKLTAKLMGSDNNSWLAIYDIETDDPYGLLRAIGQASASGKLTQSEASDKATIYTALFEEHGARVVPKS